MSARARLGFAAACALGLAAVAVGLAGLEHGRPPSEAGRAVARIDAVRERVRRAVEERRRYDLRRRARREDPGGEPGPSATTLRANAREQAAAEPVARRFHAAFSRYELGFGGWRRDLMVTTGRALARELIASQPRPAPGPRPARARLGRLELVPLASERPSRRLRSIELVGTVHRGGHREPIALELHKRGGAWQVAELGL